MNPKPRVLGFRESAPVRGDAACLAAGTGRVLAVQPRMKVLGLTLNYHKGSSYLFCRFLL